MNSHRMQQQQQDDSSCSLPKWFENLLQEDFYSPCLIHEGAWKNDNNIYCLDCCTCLCRHCVHLHPSHRLLQIRRYMYHDVMKLEDAEKMIDCASVQAYISNGAEVVFLNQRPQTRAKNGSPGNCSTCDRAMRAQFEFCCISCKVDHIVQEEGAEGLSKYLKKCEFMQLPESGLNCDLDDGQMTPDSILEPRGLSHSSSGSSDHGGGKALHCTASTEFLFATIVRKKRTSLAHPRVPCRPVCIITSDVSTSLMNRRKGIPHRAPLY